MTLAIPTIHMNGTSRNELMNQLEAAGAALQGAIKAVSEACPNGRDYYVQGPDATKEALRQHVNRLHNLTSVHRELSEIYEAIEA